MERKLYEWAKGAETRERVTEYTEIYKWESLKKEVSEQGRSRSSK